MIKVTAESVETINAGEVISMLLEQITSEGAQKRRAAILENVTPEMRAAYRSFVGNEPALKQVLVNGTMADLDTVANGIRHSVYFDVPDQKIPAWEDLKPGEREEYQGQAEAFMRDFIVLNPLEVPTADGQA
jgi:hypothetical protein